MSSSRSRTDIYQGIYYISTIRVLIILAVTIVYTSIFVFILLVLVVMIMYDTGVISGIVSILLVAVVVH